MLYKFIEILDIIGINEVYTSLKFETILTIFELNIKHEHFNYFTGFE